MVAAKRKPPEQIKRELHHEVVRELKENLSLALLYLALRRSAVTSASLTGGLRFASTTGYFLATRRVASLPFTLESANDKLKNAVAFLALIQSQFSSRCDRSSWRVHGFAPVLHNSKLRARVCRASAAGARKLSVAPAFPVLCQVLLL